MSSLLRSATVMLAATSFHVAFVQGFLIQAHAQLITETLGDDVYQVQVVIHESGNPVTVCRGGGAEFMSSDKTGICFFGEDGINNGYGCVEGWSDHDLWSHDCTCTGRSGTDCLKCSDWESCFTNGVEGGCDLCDHRGNYVCLPADDSAFGI